MHMHICRRSGTLNLGPITPAKRMCDSLALSESFKMKIMTEIQD